MLKNKIYKYFITETTRSFLTILFAFTAIAWTVRAVNFLDLVVDSGHSINTYLMYSLLNITNVITKFIPLSFLLALYLSIIKFERQNELLILWTTGLSKIKLVNLFFKFSLFVLLMQVFFATLVTPEALYKSRNLIKSSNFNTMPSIIKPNDFSDSFKSVTFYVEKKNSINEMENVFIRDDANVFKSIAPTDDDSSNTTIIAQKGVIEDNKLTLTNGIIQTQSKNGKITNINFKQTELLATQLTPKIIVMHKMQETSTLTLIKCLFLKFENLKKTNLINCPKDGNKKSIVEFLARRIGMPLYIPMISLICCFLLTSNKKIKVFKRYSYFTYGFLL
ncbi:LptF/LptG family permease [Pelagibacteraceae bacterium]|nr:LptF/LptG family permease [Pelagibacteraceae bacterium]